MRTRALGWGFALLLLAASVGRADESKEEPRGIEWPEIAGELLMANGPVALHVRVTDDLHVAVRGSASNAPPRWHDGGTFDWAAGERAQREDSVFTTLQALRALVVPDPVTKTVPHDAQGWTRGILIADLDPEAPWKAAQRLLGLARASGVRIRHVVLRSDGRTARVDLAETGKPDPDVPEAEERGERPVPEPSARVPTVTVKLFQANLDRPRSEQFTKIRVGESFTRALPKGRAPTAGSEREFRRLHEDAVFAEILEAVRTARNRFDSAQVRGWLEAPFPTGLAVPSRTAVRTLEVLRAAGLEPLRVGWTPAPRHKSVRWGDAVARVALRDAPLYVQVHVANDGVVTLRSTADGGAWNLLAVGVFNVADPEGSMQAIKVLHAELMALLANDEQTAALGAQDSHSRARLLVDADPSTLWRYVQWVVAAAASPQTGVSRFSYRTFDPPGWIDLETPKDGSKKTLGDPQRVRFLTVKLVRQNLDRAPGEQHTRVRLAAEDLTAREVDGHFVVEAAEEPGVAAPAPAPDPQDTIDLPRASEGADHLAAGWRTVEERLRAKAAGESPLVGEVATSFPKGLGVPYGDVARVVSILRRLGCRDLRLEGAPPPKFPREGGNWVFDDR